MEAWRHSVILRAARLPALCAFVVGVILGTMPAAAEQRLFDRKPFDLLILKESGNPTLEVLPLKVPQRPLTAKPTQGKISVRLVSRPQYDYEVEWTNIEQVRFFEEMLLEEAKRLTSAGDFDGAYDYYSRLLADYPSTPGVNDAVNEYLRQNALACSKSGELERALALLINLAGRNRRAAGLDKAVETVMSEIIQQHLRRQDFGGARSMLDFWRKQFRGVGEAAAAAWQKRFEAGAERQVEEARKLVAQKQYLPARKAVDRALAIWPNIESAKQVLTQIHREFAQVIVGVSETAPRRPTRRIDSWASLRSSRLVERLLAEQINFTNEGGTYRSPFGERQIDETGMQMTLKLASAAPGQADQLARYVLQMADPGDPHYRSNFARVFSGVSITPAGAVQLDWYRPHVRPDALLQVPPPDAPDGSAPWGGLIAAPQFSVAEYGPEQVVYVTARSGGGAPADGPQAVIELTMSGDEAAVTALIRGDIDVLDRLPPWQVAKLRALPELHVESYRLPTVHVLIPNPKSALLAKREFRRALCFGIDRASIIRKVFLGGATLPGFEVLSGPFPVGVSQSDPIRYAHNTQVSPRPYEPRLAGILATVAWSAVAKEPGNDQKESVLPEIPELVLAHPNDPLDRLACQSIQLELGQAGIPIRLKEFSADELLDGRVECDLRYAELAVWEPVTDATALFGAGGLAGDADSHYLNAALRRLDQAGNWKDVRARLAELHEIVHHDLPVIPLWQTVNYFAYRKSVHGVGDAPMTLYQNIEQWTVTHGNEVAQTNTNRSTSRTP